MRTAISSSFTEIIFIRKAFEFSACIKISTCGTIAFRYAKAMATGSTHYIRLVTKYVRVQLFINIIITLLCIN